MKRKPKTPEQVAADRAKYGEQHFQVMHYFKLWKAYPTMPNWDRVIDAASAYGPASREERIALLRQGKKVYWVTGIAGGRPGSNRYGLVRGSLSPRGLLRRSTYRKGSNSWTQPR